MGNANCRLVKISPPSLSIDGSVELAQCLLLEEIVPDSVLIACTRRFIKLMK